ncbi:MAG: hypothetical protein IKY28_01820 [Anaerotignum sp.]|nr:hypothetical protein [Anaerotignum sp.]
MNYSNNYGLALPEEDDFYDINPISENFAALDEALAETAAETETISDRIGTPPAGQTLVSLLTQKDTSSSVIKSIQHVSTGITSNVYETTCSISTVNPAKSFVIMERLKKTWEVPISYTLSANAVTISHEKFNVGEGYIFGFWIIEFV